ncbi:AbrB family looped-hinge helix DNA binding protein [Sinorhizobium fredii]
MATTVTAKGQVTIPKEVRDLMGTGPGSKVEFRRSAEGNILLVQEAAQEPVCQVARPCRQGAQHGCDPGLDARRSMTLVDTHVLLDVVTDDPEWADWSIAALEAASLDGPLLINDTVYAELAVRYDRIEQLDAFLSEAGRSSPRRRGRRSSSPARSLLNIAAQVDPGPASCRISSSEPTLQSANSLCLPGYRPLPDLFPIAHADRAECQIEAGASARTRVIGVGERTGSGAIFAGR